MDVVDWMQTLCLKHPDYHDNHLSGYHYNYDRLSAYYHKFHGSGAAQCYLGYLGCGHHVQKMSYVHGNFESALNNSDYGVTMGNNCEGETCHPRPCKMHTRWLHLQRDVHQGTSKKYSWSHYYLDPDGFLHENLQNPRSQNR